MAEVGFLGVSAPVRYGGAGFDYISLGILSEELEYADTSARVIISVHNGLNSLGVFQWGTEEQKQMFLAPQARGEKIAAFCLTEPDAGTDVVAGFYNPDTGARMADPLPVATLISPSSRREK